MYVFHQVSLVRYILRSRHVLSRPHRSLHPVNAPLLRNARGGLYLSRHSPDSECRECSPASSPFLPPSRIPKLELPSAVYALARSAGPQDHGSLQLLPLCMLLLGSLLPEVWGCPDKAPAAVQGIARRHFHR